MNVHTVTLKVRVNSKTKAEARQKVLRGFPKPGWPEQSVEVKDVKAGWHR